MIKAIIFDADGVMIHTEAFSKQLEREYGISTEITKSFFEGDFQKCLVGKGDLREEIDKNLKNWGWEKSTQEFLDYWFQSEHHIDEELVDFIETLKSRGIGCYLATNQEKYRTQYMIEEMGFGKVFDNVFSSAHLGYRKPNKEFYNEIYQKLRNVKHEEILFWDDTEKNVEGAKQFGIKAELYTSYSDFKRKMQQYI